MATIKVRGVLKGALVLCVLAAFWNGACGTSEPGQPHPGILVTPSAVSFNETVGGTAPGPQTIAIAADAQGTLNGLRAAVDYGSGTAGWLTASLSDTTAPATLTLTLANTGLSVATYHATIVITAMNAPNSPLNVPVTFDVAAAPVPSIVATPAAVNFEDTVGTSAPPSKTVAITANGQGTLTGLKVTVDYAAGGTGWLTVSLSDTTAPATLTLRSANAGLRAASYRATVNITAPGSPNSPQAIPVAFNVAATPPIAGITVVAVGNLGKCGGELGRESAKIVAAANPDYILMLGNSALPESGKVTTLQDYMTCYDSLWGQWKNKTYAALGDHEVDIDTIPPNYGSGMASGADAYFGPDRIGPPGKNWYSFDLGAWHVVALNVESPGGYTRPTAIQFHAGSDQMNWLETDLSRHSNKCTLAFWYQAMWISSKNIDPNWRNQKDGYRIQDIRGIWRTLFNGNADLVVNGTPHIYERFAPMDYGGTYTNPSPTEYRADSVRGVREITSGLGGDGPTTFDQPAAVRHPLSEYRAGGNGVLKLVLGDGVYSWEFLNTKYSHIQDSGTGTCH